MKKYAAACFLFIFSFLLRALAAHHGAPFCYHNDEHWIFHPVFNMIQNHTWDQTWFVLPTLTTLLYKIVGTVFAWFHPMNLFIPEDQWIANTSILPHQFPMLYVGRLMIAFFGSLTVVMIYVLLKKIVNVRFAFLFAFLYAVSNTVIAYTSFLRPEAMVIFCLTVSALFLVWFQLDLRKQQWLWLSGLFLGLASGAKYNAGFFILTSIVFLVYVTRNHRETFHHFVRICAGAVVGFVVSTPYVLWKADAILHELKHNYNVYKYGQLGDMGTHSENFLYYLANLYSEGKFSWLFYILVASILILPFMWKKMDFKVKPLLIASGFFCVSYVFFLCQFKYRAERNLIFIHPFMFIYCAIFLYAVFLQKQNWIRQAVAIVLLITTINITFHSVQTLKLYNKPLPQDLALQWLMKNAPENSRILREFDTPLISPKKYQVIYMYSLGFFTPQTLMDLDPNYLILNKFIQRVNSDIPDDYIKNFNTWIWSKPEEFHALADVPLGIDLTIVDFQKYKAEFAKTFLPKSKK